MDLGIWEYFVRGYVVCLELEGYISFSVNISSYSITTGALGSPGLLLSYSTITISRHIALNHYTNNNP